MVDLTNESQAELRQLATSLLAQVEQYSGHDKEMRSSIVRSAQEIIKKVGRIPEEQMLEDSIKAAEMVSKNLFSLWGAFEGIPTEGSISIEELATTVKCDAKLLARYARMLVSTGILKQDGDGRLAHTDNSRIFINQNPSGDLTQVMFAQGLVPYGRIAEYFKWHGLKEPRGQNRNPLTFAYGDPEKYIWEVSYANPEQKNIFMRSQAAVQSFYPATGEYDFAWVREVSKTDSSKVLFVDVGGGNGHAVKSISSAYGLPINQCVLQDMESVINEVAKTDDSQGLKLMTIDLHKEQPVKGAIIYYLRHILHDYGDDTSIAILKVIHDAMAEDSRVLIAEQMLADPPKPQATAIDLIMLNIGGKERTRAMFDEVITKAGLELIGFHSRPGSEHGVLECKKASKG